jgi:hypothetical protein
MLLTNTSVYNTKLVKFIVKFSSGLIDIHDVAINIKNTRTCTFKGLAYSAVPVISPWFRKIDPKTGRRKAKYLVVCRFGGPNKFPYQTKGYPGRKIETGRWPTPLLADWMEAMVYLVAHELMHIQQFRVNGKCSEQETEAVAMRRLTQWRENIVAKGLVPNIPHLTK